MNADKSNDRHGGAPKGNGNARKHGLNTLKAAATQLGSRVIDGRSSLSYALKKWRRDLIADLGGENNISTQQSALVDLAVKSKLILDSIDAWLLTQPRLINLRKRALLPVVIQRQGLAMALLAIFPCSALNAGTNSKPSLTYSTATTKHRQARIRKCNEQR